MKQEKEQEKAPQEEQRQKAAPPAGEEPQAAASPEKEAASQDREDLEKLQKEFDEHKQQYLRVLAEYDNFRKRTAHEKGRHLQQRGKRHGAGHPAHRRQHRAGPEPGKTPRRRI